MPVSVDAEVDAWMNADWFDAMAMLASFPAFNELDTGTEVEEGWIIPATDGAKNAMHGFKPVCFTLESSTVLPRNEAVDTR